MLKNILLNLLSNASKFSAEEKQIFLQVSCQETGLILVVKDQGMGIPAEDHAHLFTNFFRASNVSNIQGTGLGLAITKRYVGLLGGNIHLESILEKGTQFTVELPFLPLP
jgi:signal transduction histidine kinase